MLPAPISWESSKQKLTAQSTAEAEYIALAEATKEALWLRKVLRDIGLEVRMIPMYEDNQACIKIAENPVYHKRTKHIETRTHFVQDHVKNGNIDLQYIPTKLQLADILTKPLVCTTFVHLAQQLVKWSDQREWHPREAEAKGSPRPQSARAYMLRQRVQAVPVTGTRVMHAGSPDVNRDRGGRCRRGAPARVAPLQARSGVRSEQVILPVLGLQRRS